MPIVHILDANGVQRAYSVTGDGSDTNPYRSEVNINNVVDVSGSEVLATISGTVDANIVSGALQLDSDKLGGKNVIVPSVTPAISAAGYIQNSSVGGLIQIPNAARVAGGTGLIKTVCIYDKDKQLGDYSVLFFSKAPSGWTISNGILVTPGAVGASSLQAAIASNKEWITIGGHAVSMLNNLDIPFKLDAAETTLYCCLLARSAPVFTSTTSIVLTVGIEQN